MVNLIFRDLSVLLNAKMRGRSIFCMAGWIAIFVLCCTGLNAAAECRVVDLMPRYWDAVSESGNQTAQEQIASFRQALDVAHTDLYSKTGLGFESEALLDNAILKALSSARKNMQSGQRMSQTLRTTLPQEIAHFQTEFPDFKCDFAIYLVPSLGSLDGAGRVVDGRPALVLGVDSIASEFSTNVLQLHIFLDHEIFHRYHSQVSGFSDDNGQQEILWRGLWAEGLATYASLVLNPTATMQDALMLPDDLVRRASPIRAQLAQRLAVQMNLADARVFNLYFSYHPSDVDGVPPRSGYYIGAMAAQRFAQQSSLQELAHLRGAAVQKRLAAVLILLEK